MSDVLLLGGAGFLGVGLQKELSQRGISYKSVDADEIDLAGNPGNVVPSLCKLFSEHDCIVMLASKIGAKLFESDAAVCAAVSNKQMNENVLTALELSAKSLSKQFAFTYYSTSEVFGSMQSADDFISDVSPYKFDFSSARHLYAYCKYEAEKTLEKLLSAGVLSSLKILRPFNVYGRNQKRGVLFEMVKSAIEDNVIEYAEDTTRTMTDIDFASKMAVDALLSSRSMKTNVVDARCSLTMEALAQIVNDVLKLDCRLVPFQYDRSIQYRNVSKVNADIVTAKHIIAQHVVELATQLKN